MTFPEKIRENRHLLYALTALLVLSNVPYGAYVLYPFELFSTWIHETCHGLAALAVGGTFTKLYIYPDTSGLAYHAIPHGKLNQAIVSSAGYLGTTAFGALLLLLQRPTRLSKAVGGGAVLFLLALAFWKVQPWSGVLFYGVLACFIGVLAFFTPLEDIGRVGTFAFGAWMLLSLLYAGSPFTIGLLIVMGGALIFISIRLPSEISKFCFSFLAATCGLNALIGIKVLFSPNLIVNGQQSASSDAHAVAQALFGPHTLWAGLWMLLSLLLLGWTLLRVFSAPTEIIDGLDDDQHATSSRTQPPRRHANNA